MSNLTGVLRKLLWFHIFISVSSCLARNDLNLIPLFLLLVLINTIFFHNFPRTCSKVIFQVIIGMIIYDLIWVIVFGFVWSHANDAKKHYIKYWKNIRPMHLSIYLLAFVELALKTVMAYFSYLLYKEHSEDKANVKELFNFSYSEKNNQVNSESNRINNESTGRV